ncbi:MAG: hypothetical protein V4577_02590 [Bacteroidota bacterium]
MIYKEFPYSFKVWVSTLAIAPILFCAATYIQALFNKDTSFFSVEQLFLEWFGLIIVGGVFSSFTFGFFYATVKITANNVTSITICKSIISLFGVVLSMLTFIVTNNLISIPLLEVFSVFPVSYYVCAASFSWLYPLAEPWHSVAENSMISNS